jgi:hypothetical protein
VHVKCDNVQGAGSQELCNEKRTNDDGPLAVFAFQDPAYLKGWPPQIASEYLS